MTATETYGYEPETRDDARNQTCYCRGIAVGATWFFASGWSKTVWHCASHLPKQARVVEVES